MQPHVDSFPWETADFRHLYRARTDTHVLSSQSVERGNRRPSVVIALFAPAMSHVVSIDIGPTQRTESPSCRSQRGEAFGPVPLAMPLSNVAESLVIRGSAVSSLLLTASSLFPFRISNLNAACGDRRGG